MRDQEGLGAQVSALYQKKADWYIAGKWQGKSSFRPGNSQVGRSEARYTWGPESADCLLGLQPGLHG